MPAQQAMINDWCRVPNWLGRSRSARRLQRRARSGTGAGRCAGSVDWLGSAMLASALFFVVMLSRCGAGVRPRAPSRAHPRHCSRIEQRLSLPAAFAPLQSAVIRNLTFSSCQFAVALLPVIARDQLHLSAGGFGCCSASSAPGGRWRALIPGTCGACAHTVIIGGILLWAAAVLVIAFAPWTALASSVPPPLGGLVAYTRAFRGTQSAAPAWVRAARYRPIWSRCRPASRWAHPVGGGGLPDDTRTLVVRRSSCCSSCCSREGCAWQWATKRTSPWRAVAGTVVAFSRSGRRPC